MWKAISFATLVLAVAIAAGAEEPAAEGSRRNFTGGSGLGGEGVDPARIDDLIRPLDDSDPEMRKYVELIHTGRGCPTAPQKPCLEAAKPWADGGDRLARYLIHHIEASEAEGYPRRAHYLNLVAHTQSETGFQYLRGLVERRESLGSYGNYAIVALSKTRDPRALDDMLRVIESDEPASYQRSSAIRGVVRLLADTGSRRSDAVGVLEALKSDPKASDYVTRSMVSLGID